MSDNVLVSWDLWNYLGYFNSSIAFLALSEYTLVWAGELSLPVFVLEFLKVLFFWLQSYCNQVTGKEFPIKHICSLNLFLLTFLAHILITITLPTLNYSFPQHFRCILHESLFFYVLQKSLVRRIPTCLLSFSPLVSLYILLMVLFYPLRNPFISLHFFLCYFSFSNSLFKSRLGNNHSIGFLPLFLS